MFTYRRYFWISRLAPLALVGMGIVALMPSDFKAAADSFGTAARSSSTTPAALKVSMAAPRLILPAVAAPPDIPVTVSPAPVVVSVGVASVQPAVAVATSPLPDAGLPDMRPGWIGGSGVNVRAGASKDFAVLFTLAPGAEVKVRETLNGWAHIYADTGDGWIYGSYLADSPQAAQMAANDAPAASPNDGLVGHVVRLHNDTAVYGAPGGSRIYVLDAGERVKVAEVDDKWARIITASDESGWVALR